MKHGNADALSRLADSDAIPDHHAMIVHTTKKRSTNQLFIIQYANQAPTMTWDELATAQVDDTWCQKLRKLKNGANAGRFAEIEGVLCTQPLIQGGPFRAFVPTALRSRLIEWAHGVCHAGVTKTSLLLKDRYSWPSLKHDVWTHVARCSECARRKSGRTNQGKMASSPPQRAWETVAMDFCGPYLKSQRGNKYVLVFVDNCTKYVELCCTSDCTATTVVRCFYERILCGKPTIPKRLLSDRGSHFKNRMVTDVCGTFGIQKCYSSAYYPQGDGYAERIMRTMNDSISIMAGRKVHCWDDYVPGIQKAINSVYHNATGESPFLMNFGQVPELPGEPERRCEEADGLRKVIEESHARARQAIGEYWEAMKRRYDKGRSRIKIREDSQVLVKLTDAERRQFPCRKLAPKWSEPCKVVRVQSNGVTFDVERSSGDRIQAVHASRLRLMPELNKERPTQRRSLATRRATIREESSDSETKIDITVTTVGAQGGVLCPTRPQVAEVRSNEEMVSSEDTAAVSRLCETVSVVSVSSDGTPPLPVRNIAAKSRARTPLLPRRRGPGKWPSKDYTVSSMTSSSDTHESPDTLCDD